MTLNYTVQPKNLYWELGDGIEPAGGTIAAEFIQPYEQLPKAYTEFVQEYETSYAYVYEQLFTTLVDRLYRMGSGSLWCMLVDDTYPITNLKTDTWIADVVATGSEVTGPGYTQGGMLLSSSIDVSRDLVTGEVLLQTPITPQWVGSSLTARYAVFYNKTGLIEGDPVILLHDFGYNIQSIDASLTVPIDPSGDLLRFTKPNSPIYGISLQNCLSGSSGFYTGGRGAYLLGPGYVFDPAHMDDGEIVAHSIEYTSSNLTTTSIKDGTLVLGFTDNKLTVSGVTGTVRYIVMVYTLGGALGCYIDLGEDVVLSGESNFDFYFPNGFLRIDLGTV